MKSQKEAVRIGLTVLVLGLLSSGFRANVDSASALPQGNWKAAERVTSEDTTAYQPAVGLSRNGRTTLAWYKQPFAFVATRMRGRDFVAPETFPIDPGNPSRGLSVGVARSGVTAFAWFSPDGSLSAIVRSPDHAWEFSILAGPPTVDPPDYPTVQLDVNNKGVTAATWLAWTGDSYSVMAAVSDGAGEGFGPAQLLGFTDIDSPPNVAIGTNGTVTVVWSSTTSGETSTVRSATRPPQGLPNPLVQFHHSIVLGKGTDPLIDAGPGSQVSVIWRGVGTVKSTQSSIRQNHGHFSGSQSATKGILNTSPAGVISMENGETLAFSTRRVATGKSTVVVSAGRGASGLGRPVSISAPSVSVSELEASSWPNGTLNVTWISQTDDSYDSRRVVGITKNPGRKYGPTVSLSDGLSQSPTVATGPDGTAAAAWVSRTAGPLGASYIELAAADADSSYCSRGTLSFGRLTRGGSDNVRRLAIKTGSPGDLTVRKTRWIRKSSQHRDEAGVRNLMIRLTKRASTFLHTVGHIRFRVTVKFKPGFGCSPKEITRSFRVSRSVGN